MILDHLSSDRIVLAGRATTRAGVLVELAEVLAKAAPRSSVHEILAGLEERERVTSTGIGHGVALPHARLPAVDGVILALVRYPAGIDFNAADRKPIQLAFGIIGPPAGSGLHVKLLACIARLVKDPAAVQELMSAGTLDELESVLRRRDGAPAAL